MEALKELQEKSKLIRKWCLISTTEAGSGHPTSCLSAADITTLLFDKYFTYDIANPLNLFNDRFVLSKGHAAPLLYALFGMAGAYPLEELKTLRKFGSRFEGHPVPKFIYAEAATGSLGQGLSVGAGLALLAKRENLPYKTYVLTGDGELAEGQIWEAANFASYHKLDNLIAILDINRLAQSGETMFGHHIEKYVNRFEAFNFEVVAIDGHNFEEADRALQQAVNNKSGKPFAIIAKSADRIRPG
jgi:transketolase